MKVKFKIYQKEYIDIIETYLLENNKISLDATLDEYVSTIEEIEVDGETLEADVITLIYEDNIKI